MGKTSSYRESLMRALRDPVEAAAYLNAGLEDSIEAFLKAAKNVAQSRDVSMAEVAKGAGIQRETIYRSLSEEGNPTLVTLTSILKVCGLQLSIVPISESPVINGDTETENITPSAVTENQTLEKCFSALIAQTMAVQSASTTLQSGVISQSLQWENLNKGSGNYAN